MKTIEEKARAYDEALERARKIHKYSSDLAEIKRMEYIFSELHESDDDKIREKLINLVKKSHEQGGYALHKWEVDEILTWLEKQGKQTPADKVEPKFKVGDLVVDNCGNVWKIEGILNQFYLLEGVEGGESRPTIEWVNKTFHLWTIEYAKSGDVLVNGSNIFIFHFINDTRLMGYCHINTDDGRFYDDIGKNECFCLIDAVVHPATEEQRETLMKAMADAGYTFDFEKKELKKIENTRPMLSDFFNAEYERGKADALQSIEWNEEDESMYTRTLGVLGKCYMGQLPTKVEEELKWFKSIKDKVQLKPTEWSDEDEDMVRYIGNAITCKESAKYLEEKGIDMIKAHRWLESFKQEWSEEDEKRVNRISDFIWKNRKGDTDEIYQQEQDIDWLKSLRFQKQWKPTEKQINALSDVLSIKDIKYDVLSELLECLKKLK